MENNNTRTSRRKFIQHTALAGAGVMLASPLHLFSQAGTTNNLGKNIQSIGYAARDKSGKLSFWKYERRPLGANDLLIEIKYSGICHSDIHQLKGDWGPQQYPQVPGHEIVGIVTAIGREVTKFKVGDRAGVGCMVNSCMTCESCKKGEEQFCDNGATVFTYGASEKIFAIGHYPGRVFQQHRGERSFCCSHSRQYQFAGSRPVTVRRDYHLFAPDESKFQKRR